MAIPQDQNTLRSYFVNGAKPDQTKFWEFIDTMFALYGEAIDGGNALSAMADRVTNTAPSFLLIAKKIANTAFGVNPANAAAHWQILRSYNFDHVTFHSDGTPRYNFWTKTALTNFPVQSLPQIYAASVVTTYQGAAPKFAVAGGFDNEFGTSIFQLPYYNAAASSLSIPVNAIINVIAWGVP
jgi:hypothetical protein